MAILDNLDEKILKAKRAGYKEDEIFEFLKSKGIPTDDIIKSITPQFAQELPPKSITPQPVQESSPKEKFNFSIGETIANIPESGAGVIKGVAEAIRHPVETVKNIGKLGAGAIEKLIPGKQKEEEIFDAMASYFKERYGGVENIKKTIQEDPVGFAMDVSSVLSGGGALATKIGATRELSALTKVGKALKDTGELIEPIGVGVRTTRSILASGGKLGSEILGFTTGTGGEAIRQAFRNPSPKLIKAMRGITSERDILDQARSALIDLKEQRRKTYLKNLEKVKETSKDIDITPIKLEKDRLLEDFNVVKITDKQGKTILDFSRSSLGADIGAQKEISFINKLIDDWGSQPGDLTPVRVDTLKKIVDDFYSDNSNIRVFTTKLRNKVREVLVKEVEGYEKMVKDYERASNDLDEIQKTLSLKPGSNNDTAIKKLISVLKENQEYRRSVLEKLETGANKELIQQVAGIALKQGVPRGLVAKLFAGGQAPLAFGVSPYVLFLLPVSSPRLVGEFVRALGATHQQAVRAMRFADKYKLTDPKVRQALFQAERLTTAENNSE